MVQARLAGAAVQVVGLALLLGGLSACGGGGGATPPAPFCGDGAVGGGEACDDGNIAAGDGCTAACTVEAGFSCTGAPSACATACGDGLVAAMEQCDDGNIAAGDGCTAACTVEAGFSCTGAPSTCATACGDGLVAGAEQCDDQNAVDGDGCQADCTLTPGAPLVVTCATLAPLPSATCEATAGDAGLLVTGTVLVPGTVYRGGQVAVDAAGLITCAGCDCSGAPGAATATRVTCPTGVVSPGLVNLHDHITFSQNAPFADTGERYEHRNDWRLGQNGHAQIPVSGGASADQVRWSELRLLLAGATSVAGAGGQPGLLRNLDNPAQQEGLGRGDLYVQGFPLGDSGGLQLTASCAYPAIVAPSAWDTAPGALLNLGEGISASARNELTCTTASAAPGAVDLTGPRAAFQNAVAPSMSQLAGLATTGTALIWSPRSNLALYGDTTPVTAAARLGVQLALGTDWAVTGSSTMLRELACADAWNRERLGGFFTDERLWLMATRDAAEAAGLLDAIGLLAPGRAGDLVVLDGRTRAAHRAVLEGAPAGVALVVRGGKVLAGDAAVVEVVRGAAACDAVDVCGTAKRVCLADEVGKGYAALQAAAGTAPDAFACGAPPGEPACFPARSAAVPANQPPFYSGVPGAADADGDGLADQADNCPGVFNPVRPVDGGAQADVDADGEGDACDPCPLQAGTGVCPAVDPGDVDGDGVTAAADNCPAVANADQADADADGKGDACDACPAAANPGAQACPATVYQVKDGTVAAGAAVRLADLLVTGRADSGFFVQVKPGDPAYAGADLSGLWVAAAGNAVAAGDRVTVEGTVGDFFGQRQVSASAVTVLQSAGESPPAPVAVAPAEVVTGGARAAALEGVLVQVSGVSVTASGLPGNEFTVTGGLAVDDLFFLVAPAPAVDTVYASLTGILALRAEVSKLEPRSAADLVEAP